MTKLATAQVGSGRESPSPRMLAGFSVATGLRQANVKGLEWRFVDLERAHAWIPATQHKNGRPHSVPLNAMAMDVLRRREGQHPTYVFTYKGSPVSNVYTKAFKAALGRAGIEDFHWHDLRHTFATWHRQAGTPTHELQRLGGWKTQSMVERYAHVAPEGLQVAASRLDAFAGQLIARQGSAPEGNRLLGDEVVIGNRGDDSNGHQAE